MSFIPIEQIEKSILLIRGHKVMLDSDLARIYGVTTKRLNEQVKRNLDRFPEDFMFQLTEKEEEFLRSQIATSNAGRGGRRSLSYVFTEHGAVMLASVQVVRAFIHLRQILSSNVQFARKLEALEGKYDGQFVVVFDAIRQLMTPPNSNRRKIGFHSDE